MTVFKGFVAKIGQKQGQGKRGTWTLYSAKLEKEDGSEYEQWISFGFDKPDIKEGDYVKITTEKNDRGYEAATEVKRLKNAPARTAKAGSGGSTGSGGTSDSRGTHIHYQSSRKDAIEVLKLLQSQDALPLSAAKTKAGEAKRYEEVMALVDKLTIRFFHDVETMRLLQTVVDEGAAEEAAGKLPDDDEEDEVDEADEEEDNDDSDEEDDE